MATIKKRTASRRQNPLGWASSGSARGGCDPEGPGLDFALEAELGSKSSPGGTDYEGFRGQREELRLGTLPGEAFGKLH